MASIVDNETKGAIIVYITPNSMNGIGLKNANFVFSLNKKSIRKFKLHFSAITMFDTVNKRQIYAFLCLRFRGIFQDIEHFLYESGDWKTDIVFEVMEKFLSASKKAASFLARQVDADGILMDPAVSMDLCSHYKLVTLLHMSGYTREAHKVLDRIKKDFMQVNGDLISYPEKTDRDRKSSSFPMSHFWCYMNTWVAMAAQRLGRFDISYPAFEFCKTFYHPDFQMVCVTESLADSSVDSTMDCIATAHFGLLCLYMGDLELAKQCGDGLLKLLADQPDIDTQLYLRVSVSTGEIITTPPDNMQPFYCIKRDSPKQLYFIIGYYIIFMTKLFQATKDARYLDGAKSVLNFSLTCHESICMFSFSHKVAYAAALVAAETKEAKYRRFAIALGEYLMSIQTEEGLFCAEFDPIDQYDQSAEIAIWLREIDNELKRIKT